jgi:hypothetical protein
MKKTVLLIPILWTTVLCGDNWSNAFTLSLASKRGNTNLTSYAVSYGSSTKGDIRMLGRTLTDSEFSFSVAHSRGQYKGTLYEHKGNTRLVFDYHANQVFSPFMFTSWEYDSLAALDNRTNLGVGAKLRITKGFSISLAGLWENEKYTDQTTASQARLSLRPKYKRTFASGTFVQWMLFYQPLVDNPDNYLINQTFTLNLKTTLKWLGVTITATQQYNSTPPEGVRKEDTDVNLGFTINF